MRESPNLKLLTRLRTPIAMNFNMRRPLFRRDFLENAKIINAVQQVNTGHLGGIELFIEEALNKGVEDRPERPKKHSRLHIVLLPLGQSGELDDPLRGLFGVGVR